MELYLKLIDVLFPVFFIIGVGYYLGKKDPKFDTNFITNFAGNIGTPAMIFYTVTTTGITLSIFIHYFIYAIIMRAASDNAGNYLIRDISFYPVFSVFHALKRYVTPMSVLAKRNLPLRPC